MNSKTCSSPGNGQCLFSVLRIMKIRMRHEKRDKDKKMNEPLRKHITYISADMLPANFKAFMITFILPMPDPFMIDTNLLNFSDYSMINIFSIVQVNIFPRNFNGLKTMAFPTMKKKIYFVFDITAL